MTDNPENNSDSKSLTSIIRDIIIALLICGICYTSNTIINLGKDNVEIHGDLANTKSILEGKINTIESRYESDHSETARRFSEFEKKFDQINIDLNKRLDRLDNKIDSLLNRISPR